MSTRQQIRTGEAPAPGGSYSQGIAVGNLVFTAGMVPIDPATGKVPSDDVKAQTHQVMKNLAAVLAERGLGFGDVVRSTVHLQDLKRDFRAFDEVYRTYLSEPYPVRTTVGSVLNNVLVEVDVVAYRD
jgi:2-iminobutanoate/2-iminopropanoate deaminase